MIYDPDIKYRAREVFKNSALIVLIGVAYAVFVSLTGFGIPCIFHVITGLHCPGCGVSRMFLSLFKLDLRGAANANLLLLCLLPVALFVVIYKVIRYVKYGSCTDPLWLNVTYFVLGIVIFAFGVLRNLPEFSFLAPH